MANIETTLTRSGIGTKDANAALAAEVYATLEATNGNSAQAKSLVAIIRRAEQRLAQRLARKALKAGASESAVVEQIERPAAEAQASKRASKARTVEHAEVAAVDADASAERSFVERMRALAAQAEASGERV